MADPVIPATGRIDIETADETYQQHAAGEFSATLVPGSNHCGIAYGNGIAQLRYTVDIDYSGLGALDHCGFLLDNLVFQQYFQRLPPIDVSCEQLARQACKDLLAMLHIRVRHVCRCRVAIYPFGDVFVSVTFHGACEL